MSILPWPFVSEQSFWGKLNRISVLLILCILWDVQKFGCHTILSSCVIWIKHISYHLYIKWLYFPACPAVGGLVSPSTSGPLPEAGESCTLSWLLLRLCSCGKRSQMFFLGNVGATVPSCLVFLPPDVAITWDCDIYHYRSLLPLVNHHDIRLVSHHYFICRI